VTESPITVTLHVADGNFVILTELSDCAKAGSGNTVTAKRHAVINIADIIRENDLLIIILFSSSYPFMDVAGPG
jgi:hypothetical protein